MHSNFDTIRIRVHFYTQISKQRNLWGLKETIGSMPATKKGIKIVKKRLHLRHDHSIRNDSKVIVDFCNEIQMNWVHFMKMA